MKKMIITIIGKDRPGIVAAVSGGLFQMDCNIQNVNQMILQNEFAGFFVVEPPEDMDISQIKEGLSLKLEGMKLHVHADELSTPSHGSSSGNSRNGKQVYGGKDKRGNGHYNGNGEDEDIFLITTFGPDQKGLVAKITKIIASHNVNITNLKAVFKGGDEPSANIMNYQVAMTPDNDQASLFRELREKAAELNLDISIQHKNIFEKINKI
ncbi:MAG: amino acid-binding protein [Desulfamplus sp.]|nr:amino acid-binding protein [Desulfamplus sp.]